MKSPKPTRPREPRTRASVTFEENLDQVMHLISMGRREMDLVVKETKRFHTFLSKRVDGDKTKAETAKLVKAGERYAEKLTSRIGRFKTVTLWQVVLIVTCVEAYFQDLLVAAANADPKLMEKSERKAAYAEVVAAGSLDELRDEMRSGWARGRLKGGPPRWIERLKALGARGYPADLGARMELWWDVRHAVVHGAGRVGASFVRRHPTVGKKAGERLSAASGDLSKLLVAVKEFTEPTEEFFLKRWPSLIYEESPASNAAKEVL